MTFRPDGTPRSLSIFFPAYNDGGTIASLVIRAVQEAARLTSDFEVIVVNDGSNDGTAAIADELARQYPQVRVIHHPKNRGYGGALQTGFASANKELVLYTDGDAQYDPGEMHILWERMSDEVDVVTGYKISRSDPMYRVVIGRVYHHAVRLLFNLKIRDVDCDYRLMRREIFHHVALEKTSGVICLEMMRKIQAAGYRIVEVPVHHYHRTYGRSQFFSLRWVRRTAFDVLRLWVSLVLLPQRRPRPVATGARSDVSRT